MFTGIIEAIGAVKNLRQIQSEWRLTLDTEKLDLTDVQMGDSIAVNGCCLTVVELHNDGFAADVSNETMQCTTLGTLENGSRVNLEKAMLVTSRLGGHIVSGHVDGVGVLRASEPDGKSTRLEFEVPAELAKYIAAKGSICIDGTSLTVNEVLGVTFSINVIPHTQTETIIGAYRVGQKVNLEVDLIARYLERLMRGEEAGELTGDQLSKDFLQEHGFNTA